MKWQQVTQLISQPTVSRPSLYGWAFLLALAAMVMPLWSAHYLPMVDLPEHLYLINVLDHLHDSNTLYPEVFHRRHELTPYLSYYYTVWLLSHLFGLFTANALFLTLVAVATPVAVGVLAKRLGGHFWVGILACPLFYGDNFYWGFVNYCTSMPLLLLAIALCLAILEEHPHPRCLREIGLSMLLVAVQLTHEMAFGFLGLALPLLILLTPSDWRRRLRAVAATVPSVAVFAIWWLGRLHARPEIGSDGPWKGWRETFSWEAFVFVRTPLQNLSKLGESLADGFRDQSDRPVVALLAVLVVATLVLGLAFRKKEARSWRTIARGPLLAAIALALFLFLPLTVNGFVANINVRFAEVFALLVIAALPFPSHVQAQRALVLAATAVCLWCGITLAMHFRQFDAEAIAMDEMIAATGPKPKIMALFFDPKGEIAAQPAYIHFACYAAIAHGGITSSSFAQSTLSPLEYRIAKPPTMFEWSPQHFDYGSYGRYYDYYLVRGQALPHLVFRGFENEVRQAAQSGAFTLYTRRPL